MKLRGSSMTLGLAASVTAAVSLACAAGAYLFSVHHYQSLLETTRETAKAQGELIRAALEHQMIENDRTLIDGMIHTFGQEPRVENVILLDRQGRARYSSAPLPPAAELTLGSPTCQACHQYPPDQRTSSRVIETREGTLLRTVIPIRNRDACHRCHDPARRINGILIVDMNAGQIRTAMNRELRWMSVGSGALTLLLVAAIGVVVRIVVVRRLRRFETTARLIAEGDLDRRVPASGSDTISWLAREFNAMADTMSGLLGEVRTQQERLETVIDSIDDGIVVLDPQRRIIAANEAFRMRAGSALHGTVGCSCRDLTPGVCSVDDCPTLRCVATGRHQVRICQRRAANGDVAWEEVHASPIVGEDGGVAQVVEVWRDITERRATEARLAESHRLASLGLLASGFSHELNTPLATVLTCVESILRTSRAPTPTGPDGAHIEETATIAREQLLRCRGITQHFLRLSRGATAPADIVDVGPAVEAVARLIEPTARAHGVAIRVAPCPPDLHVRANEADLEHVLLNLLLNAIQACGDRPGSTVSVETGPGDPLRIAVTDTGCGIRPEHQARIFEPFFSGRQGGTGLGLFLSLDFVRRWGGDIRVRSVPGQGSTFEVLLPQAGHDPQARA